MSITICLKYFLVIYCQSRWPMMNNLYEILKYTNLEWRKSDGSNNKFKILLS